MNKLFVLCAVIVGLSTFGMSKADTAVSSTPLASVTSVAISVEDVSTSLQAHGVTTDLLATWAELELVKNQIPLNTGNTAKGIFDISISYVEYPGGNGAYTYDFEYDEAVVLLQEPIQLYVTDVWRIIGIALVKDPNNTKESIHQEVIRCVDKFCAAYKEQHKGREPPAKSKEEPKTT